MAGWSFQRKLIAGLIVIGFLAIMSSGASLIVSKFLVTQVNSVTTRQARDLADSRRLQLSGLRKILDARTWMLTGDSGYAAAAAAGSAAMRDLMAGMKTRMGGTANGVLLERVADAEGQHQEKFERALRAARSSQPGPILVADSPNDFQ